MGSGSSRLENRWWEAEAQRKVATTKRTSKVEVICSLIPGINETIVKDYLKTRSDLDVLFELNCRTQYTSREPREQHADQSYMTDDFKVNKLWQALQPRDTKPPWDSWQPPLEGIPSKIAADLHTIVCRAVFRIPFSDFVKYALGYESHHRLRYLFNAVSDESDSLRREFQVHPGMKDIYVDVEKALKQQHHPLAHWIVASSLDHSISTPHDTLAPHFDLIRKIFAIRGKKKFNFVLKQLSSLYQRFLYVGEKYNWQKWSTDLEIWECVNQTLWSGKFTAPLMPPDLLKEDQDERLRFLEGLETIAENRAARTWSKAKITVKRMIKMRH